MILCVHCGRQNKNSNLFCTYCGSRLTEEHCRVARLILMGEKDHKEYLISEAERYVGRDSSNDIVVDDDQTSARHMKIACVGGEFQVEDLGATNGTYVNGTRIQGPTKLKNEDLVKIGTIIFKFVF